MIVRNGKLISGKGQRNILRITPASKDTATLAWAAGLIDGEGCFTISFRPASASKDSVTDHYVPVIRVAMGCGKTIKRLRKIFGVGGVYFHPSKRPEKMNAHWSWYCQSRHVESVLKNVTPYLFTKREEAAILWKFFALPLSPQGGRGGSNKVPIALQRKRFSLYLRLRKLKPRFRFGTKKNRYA